MLAKVNYLHLNTLIFEVITLSFCWKDLTVQVQIPHPSQARFKFPTPARQGSNSPPPRHERWSNAMGCPGMGGMLKLRIDRPIKC